MILCFIVTKSQKHNKSTKYIINYYLIGIPIANECNWIKESLEFVKDPSHEKIQFIAYPFIDDDTRFSVVIVPDGKSDAFILYVINEKEILVDVISEIMFKDGSVVILNPTYCPEIYDYYEKHHVIDCVLYNVGNSVVSNQTVENYIKIQKHNYHTCSSIKMRLDGHIMSFIKFQNGLLGRFYKTIFDEYKQNKKRISMLLNFISFPLSIFCDFGLIL